ncbi:MAG: dehydrogenase [Firmicutes bacterium HGW-Firmicutes-15]|nr:MAG: dehydrogenase [Firmicutes bacterium HGW-Firmicutes-15]
MDITTAFYLYSTMLKIRLVEEAIVNEYPLQEIQTPVHLYIGQEAIAAGIAINLQPHDFIVSNHRSHGHCLARGMDLEGFFKELYGKQGGVTSGWGGSMHIGDIERGIIGTSAIVAGGIPIGAGVALAQKMLSEGITVIYFGDGAVDEGIFWETLNFCKLNDLPVLFVMEDNHYASQTPTEQRHAYADIAHIVQGYEIPTLTLDGNNVFEVAKVSGNLINRIREGAGPCFMRCRTYRWKGHVGCSEDDDMGYRPAAELSIWKTRCPILWLEKYLTEQYPGKAEIEFFSRRDYWQREIDSAISKAKEAPYAVD